MKLSIIIISYNTKKLLKECLDTFYKQLPKDYEVIIVDNASTDGSPAMVKKSYPGVKLIFNDNNEGFAKANNLGINTAKGEFILLLNSDTLASIKAFESLIKFMEQNPDAGITAPKLLNLDGSIQHNGGALPNLLNIFAWQFFLDEIPILTHLFKPYQQDDLEFYTRTQVTGWVSGAALCIRKSVIGAVGGLDERIFMYAEDVDWCIRVDNYGKQVWVVAESEITHLGQGSSVKARAIIGEYQGLEYVLNKHSRDTRRIHTAILKIGATVRAMVYKVLGDTARYESYIQAAQVVG